MTLPEPTQVLIAQLRDVALLLDAVAARANTDRAYQAAHTGANTVWMAMHRIAELAIALEDTAPAPILDDQDVHL